MVVSVAGYFFINIENPAELNYETQCPNDKSLVSQHTIIVIDQSTPFSDGQKSIVKDNILSLVKYNLLGDYEKLSVFHMHGRPRALEPKFQRCWPKIDDEQINKERLKQEYEDPFKEDLEKVVDKLLSSPGTVEGSPLFEWFVEIGEWIDFQENYSPRRLIFVSDMIHSNQDFSMYLTSQSSNSKNYFGKNVQFKYWKDEENTKSYFERVVRLDLRGTINLAIIQLVHRHPDHPDPQLIKEFWIEYFANSGIIIDPSRGCQRNSFKDCWDIKY